MDLVLADPPYDLGASAVDAMVLALAVGGWVGTGTVVMVERRANGEPTSWPASWTALSARRYGDTASARRGVMWPTAALGPVASSSAVARYAPRSFDPVTHQSYDIFERAAA